MKIYRLTHRSIRPFGRIIDRSCVRDRGRGNAFGVLLKERSKGWRIAYLIMRARTITCLEKHPDSIETFEPVSGKAILALATGKNPIKVKLFFLDKPVALKKGIWHGVAAVTKKAEMKIFENIEVNTDYYDLGKSRFA